MPETSPNAGGRIHFTHIGVDDGLSSARTVVAAQDPAGYMWIGTTNGLDRYDGYTIRAYQNDPQDARSLSGSWILALYIDRDGNLWVGTASGLNVYDPASDTFRRTIPQLQNEVVTTLFQDSSGLIWAGTRGNGVYSFDPVSQRLTHYQHDPRYPRSLSSDLVQKILEDGSGTLWIGTYAGLARFDRATNDFTTYRHDPIDPGSLSYDVVWDLVDDHTGTLWVGTDGGGLDAFDPTTDRFAHYRHDPNNPNSVSEDRIGCLAEDSQGDLIVGTFSAGLSILDSSRKTFTGARHAANDPASLANDTIFGCATDRSGLAWLATPGGLDIYDPLRQAVTLYRQGPDASTDLASENVTAVHVDSAGRIWVGTMDRGLDRIDSGTGYVSHYPPDPTGRGLGSPFVSAITSDQAGTLWVGTYGGGVYRLDPESNTFTAFRHADGDSRSLSDNTVMDLVVGNDGSLWVGTRSGGLNHLDPNSGEFGAYRHDSADPTSLSSDTVRTLAADPTGNIWVGTLGGGLDRLTPTTGALMHFQHDSADATSLGDDSIYALLVDRSGVLWIGFPSGGVDRMRPTASGASRASFTHLRERDGLASAEVSSIVEDGLPTDSAAGNLWIATGRGLSRLDVARQTFHTYSSEIGLPTAPLTRAHAVGPTGTLVFGTLGGLVQLDPASLQADTYVPPIVLTDLQLANQHVAPARGGPLTKPIDLTDTIQVAWDQRVISFEFAALDFRRPGLNRYRYMLQGFDRDWNEVDSTRRLVTYTNLDPGTYVFRVTGSNGSGLWNLTGRSVTLIITPPWWETWWLRSIAAMLLIGGILATHLGRMRSLQAQQRRLEALVAQRTEDLQEALGSRDVFLRTLAHDLKAPLASLSWHAQMLLRKVHGSPAVAMLEEGLQAIAASASEATAAIDELHDLTRLEAGEKLPLHRKPIDLTRFVEQVVGARSAKDQYRVEVHTADLVVDGDRSRLARVLTNLLENAIKYSRAGAEVLVSIDRETDRDTDWARVRVEDSGFGIPAQDLPHVFERYKRGSNAAHIPGEGLGLASVRQLVQLHGGRVEVQSAEHVGTTVTVWLPLERAATFGSTERSSPDPEEKVVQTK
jgi:ligand-binding sensor domain-containing protein/signal transduction histidine kinase